MDEQEWLRQRSIRARWYWRKMNIQRKRKCDMLDIMRKLCKFKCDQSVYRTLSGNPPEKNFINEYTK
jgi:hypothetical protein